jgi:diaminopimelate decarboxylase
MPLSQDFNSRLTPLLNDIVNHFGTPFHIYDETGIRATGARLNRAFSRLKGFREYFAVKALPNPAILRIMQDLGFGFDCSSIAELIQSREIGAKPEDIMFTSNNTSQADFQEAFANGGCIINLDDITLLEKMPDMPELICFRYNPGPTVKGNAIIGNPVEAKYGISHEQVVAAYHRARDLGARRFGLHTMIVSNELNYKYKVQTTRMLLELVEMVQAELDIRFEFVNFGGGLGIPYTPDAAPLDLEGMAAEITALFADFEKRNGYAPALLMESGRYMTGPHGALVVTAINHKDIYRRYIGVDACMTALMRPALYGAYHHITVHGKPAETATATEVVDVVGSLCENNDKFAIQRELPGIVDGDILLIHDTGAHGQAMGFNYNGKLRPKELLLREDGTVELIRRAETVADYFATLNFAPDILKP